MFFPRTTEINKNSTAYATYINSIKPVFYTYIYTHTYILLKQYIVNKVNNCALKHKQIWYFLIYIEIQKLLSFCSFS